MIGVNQVFLMGKCYNADFFRSESGKPVIKFTLVTFKKRSTLKDKPLFHDCAAYGELAELLNDSLMDGKVLHIRGYLDYFDNKNGGILSQITVQESQFVDPKEKA